MPLNLADVIAQWRWVEKGEGLSGESLATVLAWLRRRWSTWRQSRTACLLGSPE